jgi:hypothetical protein
LFSVSGCTLEVDIVLVSSDGHSFGGHIVNLMTFSEGFTPADLAKMKMKTESRPSPEIEAVSYTEDGKTLELLLRFMHSMETPSLDNLEFKELKAFVMAVHKYNVYHATAYCMLLMKYVRSGWLVIDSQNILSERKSLRIHSLCWSMPPCMTSQMGGSFRTVLLFLRTLLLFKWCITV